MITVEIITGEGLLPASATGGDDADEVEERLDRCARMSGESDDVGVEVPGRRMDSGDGIDGADCSRLLDAEVGGDDGEADPRPGPASGIEERVESDRLPMIVDHGDLVGACGRGDDGDQDADGSGEVGDEAVLRVPRTCRDPLTDFCGGECSQTSQESAVGECSRLVGG
jgi:hypothetical protein